MILAKPVRCEESNKAGSDKNKESVTFENIKERSYFDIGTFVKRARVAEWLFRYDKIAWITSDMLVKEPKETRDKVGRDWFCFEYNGTWYALYGKFDPQTDSMNTAAVKYVLRNDSFERTEETLPSKKVDALARALFTARTRVDSTLILSKIRYNQYVRPLDDDRTEVWWFPAWQPDGRLFVGTEYRIVTKNEGRSIVEESISKNQLHETRPKQNEQLIFPDDQNDVPSIGSILAVLIVKKGVGQAGIRSREFTSMLVDMPGEKGVSWVHVHKSMDLVKSIKEAQRLAEDKNANWKCYPLADNCDASGDKPVSSP